jgi:integrase
MAACVARSRSAAHWIALARCFSLAAVSVATAASRLARSARIAAWSRARWDRRSSRPGCDIHVIQRILGHAQVTTTRIYTEPTDPLTREAAGLIGKALWPDAGKLQPEAGS